jgi:pilus assembly protein FimV
MVLSSSRKITNAVAAALRGAVPLSLTSDRARRARLLAVAAAVALGWSVQSHALGLGDIQLRSALNQPLDAEILLSSVKADELSRINVRLADEVAYLTSGVERAPALGALAFTVVAQGKGAVIKVTTRDPVKEPFLDFIIEVNWPAGRLLREYTVLLDPPVFAGESDAAIAAPDAATAPAPVSRRASRSDLSATASGAAGSGVAATIPSGVASAGVPTAGVSTLSGATYGPTQRSDTLRGIAQQVRPGDQYSLDQVMMALYQGNPDAFFDENINNLRAGVVLRTPDDQAIAQLSQSQAAQQAREHYRRWLESRRIKSAAGGGAVGTQAGFAPMAGSGSSTSGTAGGNAQLRLLSPDDSDVSGRGGGFGGDGGSAFSDIAALDKLEKRELADRVIALESELQKMQRLVTLKDDLLAQFQSRAAGDAGMGDMATGDMSGMAAQTAMPPQQPAQQQSPSTANQGAATATTPPPAVPDSPKPQPAQTAAKQSPESDQMLMNPQMLAMIIGVLLLAGAGVWNLVRRQQRAQEYDLPYAPEDASGAGKVNFAAVAPNLGQVAPAAAPAVAVATAAPMGSGFAAPQEFAGTGIDALETDESDIDPVAEADVYLAYRRFQQAEELIRDALRKEPGREDLQLKMLEIYFGSGNKEAFEAQAEALYAMLGGEETETWSKVIEMGQELCPDHPLFGGVRHGDSLDEMGGSRARSAFAAAGAATAAAGAMAADHEQEFAPLWETGESGAQAGFMEENHGGYGQTHTADHSLDFSTDGFSGGPLFEDHNHPDLSDEMTQGPAAGGLDFDLSGFDLDKFGKADESVDASAAQAEAGNNLDFDFNILSGSATESGGFGGADMTSIEGSRHEHSMGDSLANSGEVEEVFTGLEDAELGADGTDLFGGSDMVGTKLDLARAYIDMDDRDGARGILNEVLDEGNDHQKAEARELIDKIS